LKLGYPIGGVIESTHVTVQAIRYMPGQLLTRNFASPVGAENLIRAR
jgi:hypothetical protein